LLKLGLFVCESSRDAAFRLAWPTGRASVGNGTSTGMVSIGKDTAGSCWLPTESVSLTSQQSN